MTESPPPPLDGGLSPQQRQMMSMLIVIGEQTIRIRELESEVQALRLELGRRDAQ